MSADPRGPQEQLLRAIRPDRPQPRNGQGHRRPAIGPVAQLCPQPPAQPGEQPGEDRSECQEQHCRRDDDRSHREDTQGVDRHGHVVPAWLGCNTAGMQKMSLDALAREQLAAAGSSNARRSAHTVYGGHEHVLRQTLVALVAGAAMGEHENPGEATVLVLRGRVSLRAGDDSWDGRDGDLLIVPPSRHELTALEDSAILLTVAKSDTAGTTPE
jgi:quercetin dioxygenase-like cupin family protein